MIYFYAGLGMAMITGVMAMFEVAFGIVNQQNAATPPPDIYAVAKTAGTDIRLRDQDFLKALQSYNSSWDSAACQKLIEEITSNPSQYPTLGQSGIGSYVPATNYMTTPTPGLTPCALMAMATEGVYHKIMIRAGTSGPQYFSCALDARASTAGSQSRCQLEAS